MEKSFAVKHTQTLNIRETKLNYFGETTRYRIQGNGFPKINKFYFRIVLKFYSQ